jgi:hypothetical protein
MADNIVGSLFGVDPEQLMRQRQATDASNAFRYANLDPLQQAKMSIYQGGAGLTRGITGLLGGDPELEKVSKIKQLSSQFDLTSPQGIRDFSRALQPFAPNEAMMAVARADEMEKSGLGLQKTRAEISKAELSAANEEKLRAELSALPPNATEQDVIAIVTKYGSPDKILQVLQRSQDAKLRRAEMAAMKGEKPPKPLSAGLQKSEDADLAKIDNLQAQSESLIPSITNLTKDEKGVRALELSPSKIAIYLAQNAAGNSTPESKKYAALKSAVDTAVNLQVSAEKGVQTDKDVLRFANALISAYGKFDTEATLEALKNYNNAVVTAKKKTQRIVQSRRKSQGVEEYDFTDVNAEPSPATSNSVDFSTLPKRKTQ